MQKPTMRKAPAPGRTVAEANREEEIRRRAYELYEERGTRRRPWHERLAAPKPRSRAEAKRPPAA